MGRKTKFRVLPLSLSLLFLSSTAFVPSWAWGQLVNISSRGTVGIGDNVMIAGFIIGGTTPKAVLIRGRGPSMSGAPFFVPGTLSDPLLQIFSGASFIAENDNWQDAQQAEIIATGLDPCQPNPGQSAAPPGCTQESALILTLPPGAYTAILRGAGGPGGFFAPSNPAGGEAGTGVGLVEVFELTGAVIALPNLLGVYTGSVSVTQSGCANAFNNGTFGAFATVNINSQTSSLFSGVATWNIVGETVTTNFLGTVTSSGAYAGSFTSVSSPGGLTSSGAFDGSLVGNTITIEFSGQVTTGETCAVTGTIVANR